MKMSLNYQDAVNNLQNDVSKMLETADNTVNKSLKEIGMVLSVAVSKNAPRSNNDYYWSNGVKKQNTHIADDVTYKVGKAKRTKTPYVSVSGDKSTWPKWIVANDGHVATNGKFVPGNHFVEISAAASETYVDNIVNNFMKGIVDNGKSD